MKGSGKESASRIAVRPARALTSHEMALLEVESLCHRRTIERWARGEEVSSKTELRIKRACMKLAIEERPKGRVETAA